MTAIEDTTDDLLTIGQVAERFGVTVRTLRHYDDIGLLVPAERSYAGYRLYGRGDLEALATIVTYRRLGLPLEEVAELLAGSGSVHEHLQRQRSAVMSQISDLNELVGAIDKALERNMNNQPATDQDLKELFGDKFGDEYPTEAEQGWGDTEIWQQSQARTANYTKADWEKIKAENDAINQRFAAALQASQPATSAQAVAAAEAHRVHIETWFYDLDHDFHRNLGELYVSDPRWTTTYDDVAPGLARFIADAIAANADQHKAS